MKPRKTSKLKPLATGQFWQIGDEHIHIVQVGKVLAHYKHFRTKNQKMAPVQLMNIPAVQSFLKKSGAKLVRAA